MNQIISHLIGLVSGDGHIEKDGRIVITTSNEEFRDMIENRVVNLGERIGHTFDRCSSTWKLQTRSKLLLEEMKKAKINSGKKFDTVTLDVASNLDKENKSALIAGWFDAEGWFEWQRGKPCSKIKSQE